MVLILELYFSVIVLLQHPDACICQSCEVGDRSSQGLQSHPSSQFFIASDVFLFRHGLVHVRRVAMPNGPKKNCGIVHPEFDPGNQHRTFLRATGHCLTPARCAKGGTWDNCQVTGEWN